MATWHQNRNKTGISELYKPHKTGWKVIHDKLNKQASSIVLDTKEKAEIYATKTGGMVIPPAT